MFKILALAMTLGSLVASAVSITAEQGDRDIAIRTEAQLNRIDLDAVQNRLDELIREIAVTEKRLSEGIGIAADNRDRIDFLRGERDGILVELGNERRETLSTQTVDVNENPLSSLAKMLNIEAEAFRFAYSSFLCILLEAGGLATVYASLSRDKEKKITDRIVYITTPTTSHIAIDGSNIKSLCGGSFRGELYDIPHNEVCKDCLKIASERRLA